MIRKIRLITLALLAAAIAAPIGQATVDPLAQSVLRAEGLSASEVKAWTTGVCSHQVKPASCYLSPAEASGASIAAREDGRPPRSQHSAGARLVGEPDLRLDARRVLVPGEAGLLLPDAGPGAPRVAEAGSEHGWAEADLDFGYRGRQARWLRLGRRPDRRRGDGRDPPPRRGGSVRGVPAARTRPLTSAPSHEVASGPGLRARFG
jgi:hypothetical protein